MSTRIATDVIRGAAVTIMVDGAEVPSFAGETIAAALLAAGLTAFRLDRGGVPRGPFCNMGTCMECAVTVHGPGTTTRRLRACMTSVRDGLRISTGASRHD